MVVVVVVVVVAEGARGDLDLHILENFLINIKFQNCSEQQKNIDFLHMLFKLSQRTPIDDTPCAKMLLQAGAKEDAACYILHCNDSRQTFFQHACRYALSARDNVRLVLAHWVSPDALIIGRVIPQRRECITSVGSAYALYYMSK